MEKDQNNEETEGSGPILLAILRESYLHWRHIENLRQGFTAFWAVIVAGVLAFLSRTENFFENAASIPALIFLIFFTLLGLLVSVRLSINIQPCEYNIREILKGVNLEKYDPTKGWGKGFTRHFRLRRLYIATYFTSLLFLIFLVFWIIIAVFN